jgi:hypothetical protein
MLLSMVAVFVTEYTNGGHQHTSEVYQVSAIAFPFVLVAVARGSTLRWPATAVAAIYMIVRILMGWILPLFPATPRLGPIYNPVDHMVAMQFPLLLIAPALAIDLLGHRYGKATTRTRDWLHAPVYALAFVIALLLVQWPFATFLHSSAAQNWVFFADRVASYGDSRVSLATMQRWFEQRMYQVDGGVAGFWKGIVLAIAYGSLSARLGMAWGRWMRAVQR